MSTERQPIRGKVAQLLTTRRLVLNVGAKDGVAVGMVFAVLNRRGENIVDPDTRETLGSVHIPKIEVRVEQVQDRLAVAGTYRTVSKGSGYSWSIPSYFLPLAGGSRTETLRSSEHGVEEEIDETESIAKIGDPVIEVQQVAQAET